MIMQAFPEVPAQFDGHVPEDPNDCPLVPIHPEHITARTGSHGPKGISRQHAKIFYNYDQGHFCVEVLGANGLHHEDRFLQQGEIAPLDHGDHLLIGAVNIRFYLPDIALTTDQRGRQDSGSRPMSFSFENGDGELESDEHISSESEGDLSVNPKHVYHYPIDSELESDEGVEDDDLDDYEEPRPRQKLSMKVKFGKTYVTFRPARKSCSLC
jgi:predicted component of type VI protein secretion system